MRHWRLSIVDLSENSNQPLNSKNHLFVYNGEIYNYKKIYKKFLKKEYQSDTLFFRDMLLNGYSKILNNSSGFFSYLILDKEKLEIEGGRDLWGKKPLYYYFDNEKAIFSSEETGIITILNKETKLNKDAILNYSVYKNTFFWKTFSKYK